MAGAKVVVAAVAGRRIDGAATSRSRFPASAIPRVEAELRRIFWDHKVTHVVSSAACGADILALEAAAELGLASRIVLPFGRERFRARSVVDRGPEWGPRFDAVIATAERTGDLVVLPLTLGGDNVAYATATKRILDDARASAPGPPMAIAIWDGRPREFGDATKDFVTWAVVSGMELVEISTLP